MPYDSSYDNSPITRVSLVDSTGQPDPSAGSGGSAASTIGDGLKLVTTAGTRETLAASTTCTAVTLTAKQTNTGTVVVGAVTVVAASGAGRRGTPLNAGDSLTIEIDNLSKVYLDVTVNGEGVTYTYLA